MPRNRLNQRVASAIDRAAERYGLDPEWLRAIARVESGFNPTATTGSYSGLFQLKPSEFEKLMPGGNISDPGDNAMAAASLLASHRQSFRNRYGRDPSLGELYIIHQQGWGGFQAHATNPDRPAWENWASTREGQARGPQVSRDAIWGNIPPSERRRFGSVENVTSRQFMELWNNRLMGQNPPDQYATEPEMGTASVPGYGPTRVRGPDAAPQPLTPEPGFFDRQYPLVHALTGQDKPVGQQLLGSIFGGEGLASNRRLGAGLAAVGKELAGPETPLPQISIPGPDPRLDQDERAFVLPRRPQRRYA